MENKTKTTVFNLIILDESGSMQALTEQTVSGCNETLNVIRSLEKKHGETQRNLVSIYLFQSNPNNPSHYICKNVPIGKVGDIGNESYRPWGGTPLLDAVGSTLVDLRAVASTHEDSTGVVTIITDGMENSSTQFSYEMVAKLISEMKEMGWTFNFIGANIDVDAVANKMHIDNSRAFEASRKGTKDMWDDFGACYERHYDKRVKAESNACCMSKEDRIKIRKSHSKDFF